MACSDPHPGRRPHWGDPQKRRATPQADRPPTGWPTRTGPHLGKEPTPPAQRTQQDTRPGTTGPAAPWQRHATAGTGEAGGDIERSLFEISVIQQRVPATKIDEFTCPGFDRATDKSHTIWTGPRQRPRCADHPAAHPSPARAWWLAGLAVAHACSSAWIRAMRKRHPHRQNGDVNQLAVDQPPLGSGHVCDHLLYAHSAAREVDSTQPRQPPFTIHQGGGSPESADTLIELILPVSESVHPAGTDA